MNLSLLAFPVALSVASALAVGCGGSDQPATSPSSTDATNGSRAPSTVTGTAGSGPTTTSPPGTGMDVHSGMHDSATGAGSTMGGSTTGNGAIPPAPASSAGR